MRKAPRLERHSLRHKCPISHWSDSGVVANQVVQTNSQNIHILAIHTTSFRSPWRLEVLGTPKHWNSSLNLTGDLLKLHWNLCKQYLFQRLSMTLKMVNETAVRKNSCRKQVILVPGSVPFQTLRLTYHFRLWLFAGKR